MYICQNTCFFGKRPELSQEKSRTMFFKVRSQFFFGISKTFLIHNKLYPQDDHPLNFFVKKSWFSIFFDNFFLPILLFKSFWQIFFTKKVILNCHFEGNAYGELNFFQKFQKKIDIGSYKTLFRMFPEAAWSGSNKQVFCHIDFILSSMNPC